MDFLSFANKTNEPTPALDIEDGFPLSKEDEIIVSNLSNTLFMIKPGLLFSPNDVS